MNDTVLQIKLESIHNSIESDSLKDKMKLIISLKSKQKIVGLISRVVDENKNEMREFRNESLIYKDDIYDQSYILVFNTNLVTIIDDKVQFLCYIPFDYLSKYISIDLSSDIYPYIYLTVFNKIIDMQNMIVYSDINDVKQIAYKCLCVKNNISGNYDTMSNISYKLKIKDEHDVDVIHNN